MQFVRIEHNFSRFFGCSILTNTSSHANDDELDRLFQAALGVPREDRQTFIDAVSRGISAEQRLQLVSLLQADDAAEHASFLRLDPHVQSPWDSIVGWWPSDGEHRIQHVAQQFAEALQGSRPARIEDFLDDDASLARDALFARLLEIELAYRRRNYLPIDVQDYLERFPQDAARIQSLLATDQPATNSLQNTQSTVNVEDAAIACMTPQDVKSVGVTPCAAEQTIEYTPANFANGRYETIRELGAGGQKRVVLAFDQLLRRKVVVSIQLTTGNDALRREAALLAQLGDHPHIVTIFDLGEADGCSYIVSQYVTSGSLRDLLSKNDGKPLQIQRSLEIARQTCEALSHAHSHGVLHLDIKPGNVWLMNDGSVRLGDFGLARRVDWNRSAHADSYNSATLDLEASKVAGTPAYMAPEQVLNEDLCPQTDLYSVGVMLYELTTGQRPFAGASVMSLISQHLNMEPVAPSRLNPLIHGELNTLILSLLAKHPSRRPADAMTTVKQLSRLSAQSTDASRATSPSNAAISGLARGIFIGRH